MIRELGTEWREWLRALAPGRFPYARFTLAMAVGVAGGLAFVALKLPLPWMLGPMTACTLAALLQVPVAAPGIIRSPMTTVLGVLLGANFSPDMIARAPQWWPAILGLVAFMLACAAACSAFFRMVGGFDRSTAFFSGMPGGLVEMVTLGEEKGGKPETIALVHSARVLMVVMSLPFLVQWLEGVQLGGQRPQGLSILETPVGSDVWLLGCAIGGVVLGKLLRLPARLLLGPMLASAIVHVTGLSDFRPPSELIIFAQLILGATVGCRFVGTPPATIARILGLSVGSTLILLAMTLLFAFGSSRFSGMGLVPLILAYSPGGLAEMSLIALSLKIEVAFVAALHIIRIFLITATAGALFRWTLGEPERPKDGPSGPDAGP